jgi:hypothetical protein
MHATAWLALAAPWPVAAQQVLLHFPLDGSPQAQGPAAAAASIHVAAGGAAPVTVPGKFGEALRFDGKATIAMPFSLDAVAYPDVTVTAWVKVDADSRGDRTVFSAGNGNVPKLSLHGDRAHFVAARGSAMFGTGMPRDEWVFVAGVIELDAARLAVYQGDGRQVREGISTANLYPPSSYRHPDDPTLPGTRYVFVGSHGFNQWRAQAMAIDDVRVYAGALSPEQLAALRKATTGESLATAPGAGSGASTGGKPAFFGGALTDENVAELAKNREGQQPIDITYASEEEALAAAERREREAAEAELARQQNELEAQRRAKEDQATVEAAAALRFEPVGDPRFSSLAGIAGENVQMLDVEDQFIDAIELLKSVDGYPTCGIAVWGSAGKEARFDGCEAGDRLDRRKGQLADAVIGSISVCRNLSPRSGSPVTSVSGARITGHRIKDDGTSIYVPAGETIRLPYNCVDWTPIMLCPVNPEHLATGVVVHSRRWGDRFSEIVGLQLVCRRIGTR